MKPESQPQRAGVGLRAHRSLDAAATTKRPPPLVRYLLGYRDGLAHRARQSEDPLYLEGYREADRDRRADARFLESIT